ncbi:hypothetical protein TrST_g3807 [Triparma strigata]|uniref:Uncharacterized protein n=1 Tax=Triparma strigata TaxID=1606541 RepID=A0A9W7BSK5_9STRA|nr:hypothetical protein TrST_g3807 [Triparma strigata]
MPTTKPDPGNHRESQVSRPVPHGPTTDDSPAPIYSLYGAGEHGTTPSEEIRFSRCVNVKGFDTDLPVRPLEDDRNVKKSWQLMDGVLDEGLDFQTILFEASTVSHASLDVLTDEILCFDPSQKNYPYPALLPPTKNVTYLQSTVKWRSKKSKAKRSLNVEYLNWWKKRETETGVIIAVEGLEDVPKAVRAELEKVQEALFLQSDRVTFRGFYRLEREGYNCTSCVLRLKMKVSKSAPLRRLSISNGASNEGIIRSLTSRFVSSTTPKSKSPRRASRSPENSGRNKSRSSPRSASPDSSSDALKVPNTRTLLPLSKSVQVLLDFSLPFAHFFHDFSRVQEVDEARWDFFAKSIPEAPELNEFEAGIVQKGIDLALPNKNEDPSGEWQRIATPYPIHMFRKQVPPLPAAWGKAVASIDIPADELLSYNWIFDSFAKMEAGRQAGDLFKKVFYLPNSRSQVCIHYQKGIANFKPRLFCTYGVWSYIKSEASAVSLDSNNHQPYYVYSFCPLSEVKEAGITGPWDEYVAGIKNTVSGVSRGCYIIKPTSKKTCEWTFIVYGHAAGFVPSWAVNWKLGEVLRWPYDMKMKFENLMAAEEIKFHYARLINERSNDGMDKKGSNAIIYDFDTFMRGNMFARCKKVEENLGLEEGRNGGTRELGSEWEKMAQVSPFVRVFINSRRGGVYAETIVDCPCAEALAWLHNLPQFLFNRPSNVKGTCSILPLTPTGLQTNVNSPQQYAQVYPSPYFVKNREFVMKAQWIPRGSNGEYYLIFESVDEDEEFVVDYGQKMNNHRASKIGFFRITDVVTATSSSKNGATLKRCKIEYLAKLDLNVNVGGFSLLRHMYPKFEKESLETHAHDVVLSRDVLAKDDLVDESTRQRTEESFLASNGGDRVLESFEKDFEEFWSSQYKTGGSKDFSSHPFVKTKVLHKTEEFYVHESFVLDASPAAILAYLFNPELRKRVRKTWKEDVEYHVVRGEKADQEVNEKKVALVFNTSHGRIGADPTVVCCTSGLYKWAKCEDGTTRFVVMNPPLTSSPSSSFNSINSTTSTASGVRLHNSAILSSFRNDSVRARVPDISLQLLVKMTPIDDVGGIPQTKVDFKVICNFAGVNGLGHSAASKLVEKVVATAGRDLWEEFDRSGDVDAVLLNRTLEVIRSEKQTYSWEEEKMIASGIPYLGMFESNEIGGVSEKTVGLKSLTLSSPLVEGKVAYPTREAAYGSASSVVRASAEEILAFIWNTTTRKYLQAANFKVQDIVLEPNSHARLNYARVHVGGGFKDREFLGWSVWKKINSEVYIHVAMPAEHELRPKNANCVRGKYPAVTKLTRLSDNETRVDYIVAPELGSIIPKIVTVKYMYEMLDWNYFLQAYFLKQRRLEVYDVKDGVGLGEAFFIATSSGVLYSKINAQISGSFELESHLMDQYKSDSSWHSSEFKITINIFTEYRGMKYLRDLYPWVVPMMAHVIINKLRPSENCDARCKAMSINQGRLVGKSFAQLLATNLTYAAAVDEWILRYPCLREIDSEYDWFRPMMETVGCRLLGKVAWGTKLRVFLGASLSVIDMLSDLYLVREYFSLGDDSLRSYAFAMIVFIGLNIGCQLILVVLQNRVSKLVTLREIIFVIFCMKPGIDAYRVAIGEKQGVNHVFRREVEMHYTRASEIVFESIPGTILQIFVIVNSGVINRARIFSLLTGSLVTGFMSASMCYDFDTNPVNRKSNPDFYGMIDDKRRYLPFSCLTLMGSIMLLVRCLSCAMLLFIGWKYLVSFIAIDLMVMIAFKFCMADFSYWFPVDSSLENAIFSFLIRVFVKIMNDFIAIAQLRHPYELGGAYWTFSLIVSIFSSFLSTYLYTNTTAIEDDDRHFEDDFLWTLVGCTAGSWAMLFLVFIWSIKEDYIYTFFSTKRGADCTMDYFLDNDVDEIRANIFQCNKRHWVPIRLEVKEWCLSNFEDWWEAGVEWLDCSMLAAIPDDFIPESALTEIKKQRYMNMLRSKSFSDIGRNDSAMKVRHGKQNIGRIVLGMNGVVDRKGGSGFLFRSSNLGGNNLGRAGARGRSIDNISPNLKFRMQNQVEYNRRGNTEGDEGMGTGLGGSRDYAGSAAPGSMDYGSPTAYGYDGPRSLPFTPGIPNRISYTQGARKAILKENKEGIDNMARIMKKQERSWGGRKARGGNEYSAGGEKKDGGVSPIQRQGSKEKGKGLLGSLLGLRGGVKIAAGEEVNPRFDYANEVYPSSGRDSEYSSYYSTISSGETPNLPVRALLNKHSAKNGGAENGEGDGNGKQGGEENV